MVHVVVLVGEHSADEADRGGVVGEDPDDSLERRLDLLGY